MVQWLRFHLPRQGVWVGSLVKELRAHMPQGQKKKNQTASNRSNAVANVIKTLKFNKDFKNGPHQKKIIIIIIIGIVRQEETPTPPEMVLQI